MRGEGRGERRGERGEGGEGRGERIPNILSVLRSSISDRRLLLFPRIMFLWRACKAVRSSQSSIASRALCEIEPTKNCSQPSQEPINRIRTDKYSKESPCPCYPFSYRCYVCLARS